MTTEPPSSMFEFRFRVGEGQWSGNVNEVKQNKTKTGQKKLKKLENIEMVKGARDKKTNK